MPAKPERIEVFNINTPGKSSLVQKDKYEEVKKIMKALMPTQAPGMTQDELAKLVIEHVSNAVFEDRSKAGWWMKIVQLDLEARQVLIREKAKPLRWHYDPTREEKVPEASRPRSAIKKIIAELPISIKNLLLAESLYEAYQARPFYQRNDYIHWIMGAKREDTAQKRIAQMIRELSAGNLYMNMEYRK